MAYQYDPALDPSFGQTNEPAPLTSEQRQANYANQSARGRQSRHEHTSSFGDTGNHEIEVELSNVQKQLSSPHLNPAERASLENKAWTLAERLTGGGEAVLNEEPVLSEEVAQTPINSAEDYAEQLAQEGTHEEDLLFASQNFDTEVSEAINSALDEAKDAQQVQSAMGALHQLRQNPDWIASSDAEPSRISEAAYQEIESSYDSETAYAIRVINENLVAGNITRGQAMKTAMQSPRVLDALLSASKAGLLKLAL